MATLSTVYRESAGSNTLLRCAFTAVSNNDTWASGLPNNVVGFWMDATSAPTQGKEKIDVAYSNGTFTFYEGGDGSRTGQLCVLIKG